MTSGTARDLLRDRGTPRFCVVAETGAIVSSRVRKCEHYSSVAQLAEHSTVNRRVAGSSPAGGAEGQSPIIASWTRGWGSFHACSTPVRRCSSYFVQLRIAEVAGKLDWRHSVRHPVNRVVGMDELRFYRNQRYGAICHGRIVRHLELPDLLSAVLGMTVAKPASTGRSAFSASRVSDFPVIRRW